MEYQIRYDRNGESKRIKPSGKWLKYCRRLLVILCVICSLLWALDVDMSQVFSAADSLVVSLQEGNGIEDAFSEFCLDILEGTV